MDKVKWGLFSEVIVGLYDEGKTTSQILRTLKERYPKIKFPLGSKRRIREILARHKKSKPVKSITPNTKGNLPKVLIFDIETAPMVAYTFSKKVDYIQDDFIKNDWFILSWAAKWLFSDTVISDKLTKEELKNSDDRRISKSIWELIDEADVIIAHNLNKFDIKKVNTKFLKYKLGIPSPYQKIDTLQHVRKQFAITSNRLDYVAARFLGIEGKMDTPKGLWRRCMENDYEALKIMDEYCVKDVLVLEAVYLEIRPWIRPHPNMVLMALSNEDGGCPVCTSKEKEPTNTEYHTYVNSYTAHRCGGCGHIYRERKSNTTIKNNPDTKVSIPR